MYDDDNMYDLDEIRDELDALYREIADAWDVLRSLGIRDYTDHGMRTVGDGIRELAGLRSNQGTRDTEHAAGTRQLSLFDVA